MVLLAWLDEPSPGATSWWARRSVRGRSLVRIAVALIAFVGLSLVLWADERIAGMGNSPGRLHRGVLAVLLMIFLFAPVYVFIVGLAGLVTGRPWQRFPGPLRIAVLLLFTPPIFGVALMAAVMPGAMAEAIGHASWFEGLRPGFPQLKSQVLALAALDERCQKASGSMRCACDHRTELETAVHTVEALVREHPELASFEILQPTDKPGVEEVLDLGWVQRRLIGIDPLLCGGPP